MNVPVIPMVIRTHSRVSKRRFASVVAYSGLRSGLLAGQRWPGHTGWAARINLGSDRSDVSDRSWSSHDYFVFLGESRVAGSLSGRPTVFVQVCCLIERVAYCLEVVPALEHFKQRWFGRTDVPLLPGLLKASAHPFKRLESIAARRAFAADFYALMTRLPFRLFAVAVLWTGRWKGAERSERTEHVYDKTVPVWLPRLCEPPSTPDQPSARSMTILAESHSEREDAALWLRFRAGRQVLEQWSGAPELWFEQSAPNAIHAGFDIARVAARPMARHVRDIEPHVDPAFECLRLKLMGSLDDKTGERGICRVRR